jgi:hypothetical protein
MVLLSASPRSLRPQGIGHEAVPNSSTGSASVTSDNRLSPPSGDAPETSPFRRLGYSKRQARPPKGTVRTGNTRRNRDPRRAFHPGQTASAQLLFGSAGGPHRCAFVSVTVRCHRSPAWGPIQANGVRVIAAAGTKAGSRPSDRSRSTRSPFSPQLGRQLPPPVRCLACHLVMSFISPGGFGFLPFYPHDARNFLGSNAICFRHR